MKMIFHQRSYQSILLFLIFWSVLSYSQTSGSLTLKEAIQLGIAQNKALQASLLKTQIAETKQKDTRLEKLPNIDFHTNYSQITNLHQYENGLFSNATEYDAINGMYDFTLSTSIPIYKGGKLRNQEKKAAIYTEIAKLNHHWEERQIKILIINTYLQILHLEQQKNLIQQKIIEDSVNIKQTQILKNNGVVTQNEVLRTSLQLSNHQMSLQELENDIDIAEHQLKTILSVPEEQSIHADTSNLLSERLQIPELDKLLKTATLQNEKLEMAFKNIEIKELEHQIVKSNYLPNISLGGEYFLKYPNMMFFPPEPYAYRLGMVGITLNYPIESLYKNKYKMQEAKQNIELSKLEFAEKQEALNHQVYEATKKFEEAGERISIAQKAIEQAKENYRIVKTKYANKLSLITELIDADNAYLEAQSNLISAKINQQLKYYQLQYIIGNL